MSISSDFLLFLERCVSNVAASVWRIWHQFVLALTIDDRRRFVENFQWSYPIPSFPSSDPLPVWFSSGCSGSTAIWSNQNRGGNNSRGVQYISTMECRVEVYIIY